MAGFVATRLAATLMAVGVGASLFGLIVSILSELAQQTALLAGLPRITRFVVLAAGGGLVVLGGLVAVLGLALYVLIPAFSARARAHQDYGSHRVVLACTLLAALVGNVLAALYFIPTTLLSSTASGLSGPELAGRLLSPTGIVVAAISLDIALLAVVYLRIVRPGAITWSAMGLSPSRLPGGLVLGFLFGLVLFGVSSLLELLLNQMGIHQTQHLTFESIRRADLSEFGLVLLAGAVIAPAVEEVYFRGYVFRAYLDKKGTWPAFLFSAALFAVVHLNLPALLPIFAMGLLLSFIYYRTGSIVPAIVAHSVNNAAAFTLLYLGLA